MMLSYDEMSTLLTRKLTEYCAKRITDSMPLHDAVGKTAAYDIHAEIPLPSVNTAAMDGYIFTSPLEEKKTYTVTSTIAAGDMLKTDYANDEVIRINTGAPVPDGYSFLIMQEQVRVWTDNQHTYLQVTTEGRQNHIRKAGEDVAQGSVLFSQGHQFRLNDLPVIAAIGLSKIPVLKPLTIGVASCGNELLEPGQSKNVYQAYDCNRAPLLAMIKALGHTPHDFGIIPDNQQAIRSTLFEMAKTCDLILTSGGASVGDFDFFAKVLQDIGKITEHKVAMKPGKPLLVGHIQSRPYIGLPGNPVSSFVCFQTLVAPALRRAFGQAPEAPSCAKLTTPITKSHQRLEFARAIVNGDQVTPLPQQESHRVGDLRLANGLIVIPPGPVNLNPGDEIRVLHLEY